MTIKIPGWIPWVLGVAAAAVAFIVIILLPRSRSKRLAPPSRPTDEKRIVEELHKTLKERNDPIEDALDNPDLDESALDVMREIARD